MELTDTTDAIAKLKAHLGPIEDLKAAASVLRWDQETFMPPGGAEARAQQLATLQTLAHEKFASDATGELIDDAADALNGASKTDPDAALVRVTRHDYERARRLPSDLVERLSKTASKAQEAWKKARANDDFSAFAPLLKDLVDLSVEKAEAIGYDDEAYDALLDEFEPGLTTSDVTSTFAALRDDLVPIVDAIADADPISDDALHGDFPVDAQKAFGESVIRDLGYDFDRGRQDESAHPFTTSFAVDDVRLTTRYDETFFPSAFYSMLHEAGHGMYEQGIDAAFDRTPLGEGTSLGVHESQSRFWENVVGRSRAFWQHYLDDARAAFPEALDGVDAEAFYRAVNVVEPSLIRVEADEVTYCLHVMLRFELERGLIRGTVAVDDLPDLWREKMDEYLGVVPDTDADGVLQDVHWSQGAFGYFPTYALGTLASVQLWEAMQDDLPDAEAHIARGDFDPLLDWLRDNVHGHGRTLQAPDLLTRVTGSSYDATPWLNYVQDKYGELYGI